MSIRIRLARYQDARHVADMSRRFIEHGLPWSWDEARVTCAIAHSECAVITARDGRRLTGFAIMQFHDSHAHLNLLAVNPGYRRRGTGRQLVEWLEASARVAGTFLVKLELRVDNLGAYQFYQRLGYSETERRPRYYAGREDALCMMRNLAVSPTSRA
jgi:ribosomal protein S18 acetylase RimI-like enzyme